MITTTHLRECHQGELEEKLKDADTLKWRLDLPYIIEQFQNKKAKLTVRARISRLIEVVT